MSSIYKTVSALMAIFVLQSCAVSKNPTRITQLPPDQRGLEPGRESATTWQYRIQVGDELDIKFYYNPELNERVTVRPDGRIALQLVPEVQAVGSTAEELARALEEEYARELRAPEVAVIVRSFSAQRVYVAGEVQDPGELALVGPLTVLQSIARAGGLRDTARLAEVLVIRRNVDRTPLIVPVNLKHAINGTDLSQDIALMPYDVVFVPRSVIANVNKWVDQYVRENIPVSFGFRADIVF